MSVAVYVAAQKSHLTSHQGLILVLVAVVAGLLIEWVIK